MNHPLRVVLALNAGDGELPERAVRLLRATLDQHVGQDRLAAVAHRIVHGGERHIASIALDDQALSYLDSLARLATLSPRGHRVKFDPDH